VVVNWALKGAAKVITAARITIHLNIIVEVLGLGAKSSNIRFECLISYGYLHRFDTDK
jgi:hypothetical protein